MRYLVDTLYPNALIIDMLLDINIRKFTGVFRLRMLDVSVMIIDIPILLTFYSRDVFW
jgi:hypothetical protein